MRQPESKRAIVRDRYDAVLLDLDGVITNTASLHAACWKTMFDEYLQTRSVIVGFAGLDLRTDTLGIDPKLPPQWRSLSFRVCWRGRSVAIHIAGTSVTATLVEGEAMEIRTAAARHTLTPGATLHAAA